MSLGGGQCCGGTAKGRGPLGFHQLAKPQGETDAHASGSTRHRKPNTQGVHLKIFGFLHDNFPLGQAFDMVKPEEPTAHGIRRFRRLHTPRISFNRILILLLFSGGLQILGSGDQGSHTSQKTRKAL